MELIVFSSLIIFSLFSFYYVYAKRGQQRYAGFTEYLRKGWPLFSPFNCVLYLFTKPHARKPIMKFEDFPELQEIINNWESIKEEVVSLKEQGFFDQTTKQSSASYYDLGFRTFYKYGWSKFYINWYGYTHASAKKLCPKTVDVLKDIKTVNGAMFSLLPIGSKLTRHLDPIASSLRLHIALDTPGDPMCYINVDGQDYFWKDGEAFIFDETYIHYANNNSRKDRLILMCDIDRPMYFPGSIVNSIAKFCFKASIVPNLEGDKKGLVNKVFSGITPVMMKVRTLKESNMFLYKLIKHTVNLTLLMIILGLFYVSINAVLTILS
jgi:beta-hydroxylase